MECDSILAREPPAHSLRTGAEEPARIGAAFRRARSRSGELAADYESLERRAVARDRAGGGGERVRRLGPASGSARRSHGRIGWWSVRRPRANEDYERRAAAAAHVAEAQQILREWRRREMLRIAWRDIAAAHRYEETLRDGFGARGRLHPRGGPGGAHAPARDLRHAARRRTARRSHFIVARHGQARRRGAELLLRHRSRVPVRRGRRNGRAAGTSPMRSTSTASAARSFDCSMRGRRKDSSFASTCACARSARAAPWS